jgi:enoyl-CoA hydratase
MAEPVVVERRGHVQVITISRPEARNALDGAAARALAAAADELDADAGLRVGVLTGAGGTFCAGMDLKAWMRGDKPMIAASAESPSRLRASRSSPRWKATRWPAVSN